MRRVVALEGVDGIGKSTLVSYARSAGYPVYKFDRFPEQNALNSKVRWKWMDYLHVQVAKALSISGDTGVVFFDRSIASNVVTRWLSEGKHGTIGEFSECSEWYASWVSEATRLAEEAYSEAGMVVAILRPHEGEFGWVAKRNSMRPEEPEWTSDETNLLRIDSLYSTWRLNTKMNTVSVPVLEADTTPEIFKHVLEAARVG